MSYKRRFRKQIEVYYSGSVSYPASQNGGTQHYSGSTTETIEFDVLVDTDPFDEEVGEMRNHVDALTGSVIATKAAHIDVIDETSRTIGDTIVAGFFKTVKSEISQQIAELTTRCDALILQINKLMQRCNAKKSQMMGDYQRISSRYGKIFTDLNNELENRIYSIDEPVFSVVRSLENSGSRTGADDSVTTVSVTSGENARAHSIISSSIAKKQAANAISLSRKYLATQYATDEVLNKCLLNEEKQATYSSPYCIIDTIGAGGSPQRAIFASPILSDIPKERLAEKLDNRGWKDKLDKETISAIADSYKSIMAEAVSTAVTPHDRRVADLTARLFNLSKTASVNGN